MNRRNDDLGVNMDVRTSSAAPAEPDAGPTEQHIEIPPFFCPIEPVMHPDKDAVHRRSGQWAQRLGLVRNAGELERWYASTSADFYGGMVPNAVTEQYQIAANWVYWGFSLDDAHCDEGGNCTDPTRFIPVAARLLRILDTGDESLCRGDPHLLGLCDLAHSYRRLATPAQTERWINAHRRWLFGVVQQNAQRAAGGPKTLDDFFVVRLHDCGGPPTQSMFEFANAAEIPGSELHAAPVRALTELFWMVAALDNDRVSRHKEMLGQQDGHNLTDAVRTVTGTDAQEAEATAIAYRDRLMLLFLRLREQVRRGASEPLRIYLDSLAHGIRANIDWSLRTPRYTVLYAADGITPAVRLRLNGSVVDSPAVRRAEPLPFPSIAWWWTQLD
ncbi:MAG: hypothetical protein IJH84_24115 [Saccharopolyspora sp.]|uniref:terpene synthase family protein n=1 Tax=Saccharopolyspora sp. TaxID=33915 RepID=UPI0025D44CA5|nr:terpene synthase family protein [Saccharopolyspora sp.]MBQ6644098.1 hypothetical protein [Saccharopolyspora sp.]